MHNNFIDETQHMVEQRECGHAWIRVAGKEENPMGEGPCPACKREAENRKRRGRTRKR